MRMTGVAEWVDTYPSQDTLARPRLHPRARFSFRVRRSAPSGTVRFVSPSHAHRRP